MRRDESGDSEYEGTICYTEAAVFRLDYDNATLAGSTRYSPDEFPCTTCMVGTEVRAHTPLLRYLRRLRVPQRIELKLATLVFRRLYGTAVHEPHSVSMAIIDSATALRVDVGSQRSTNSS